ncbi:hypothetical protein [Streptomyces phaeochromogenes]
MPTTADSTAFSTDLTAVRGGTFPDVAAEKLLERLIPEERSWLLDGDQPFWQGLPRLMAEGYDRVRLWRWAESSGRNPRCAALRRPARGGHGRLGREATAITYDKWIVRRLLDRDGRQAAFLLGYGLSRTTVTLAEPGTGP